MPRRQRGHPGETEPPENTDHEGPAPADLLQMWITGRQAQTAATPETPQEPSAGKGEPETDAEAAPEPDTGADQVQGWASFGHARTAEDVLERSEQKPWLDVLLGETATPPHPPAEPEKPALLRELDHDEEPTGAAEPEAHDPDATAVWTLEDIDAYDDDDGDGDGDAEPLAVAEPEPIPELASIPLPEARPEPEPAPFAPPLTEAPAERVDIGWPEEPDDGWEDVPPPVGGPAAYIARWGSADDWQADDWEPDKWQSTEPPVAEDPPVLEVAAPPVESTPEATAPAPVDVLAEPVTPDQPSLFGEQVTEPDLPWDPDSTQDYDWRAVERAEAAPVGDGVVVDVPGHEEASPEAGPGPTTSGNEHGPVIPEHVEYRRRASYRPLLGILFVVAAVLAVVAIFWAVSQGGSSSIGIAIGVTAFALAFWWGLISWTPTVVSVDGPILEVTRGADGERFDLRDPDLDIDVGDDTASRSWRATITRPDGTELVIPASAVDAHEFTAIVQHYRGQVEREDHPSR